MQQMKQKIYAEIFVAFLKFPLTLCYRTPPSTKLHSEPRTKCFIFSFFRRGIFSLNNFLQVLDYDRDCFSKTALFQKINLVVSITLYIFVK